MNRWKIPKELEIEIMNRDFDCVYCGIKLINKISKGQSRKNAGTWEHIINDSSIITRENIARCCSSCNSSKGTKKLQEWLDSDYCSRKNINFNSVAPIIKKALKQKLG
jgi:hypothetical protein